MRPGSEQIPLQLWPLGRSRRSRTEIVAYKRPSMDCIFEDLNRLAVVAFLPQ